MIYLFFIALTWSSHAQLPDSDPIFESFKVDVLKAFLTHPKRTAALDNIRAAELSYRSTRFESPWTFEADLSASIYESDPTIGKAAPSTLGFDFKNRNGLEMHSENQFFQRDSLSYRHVIPYQGALTVGKEVWSGGARSYDNIKVDIQRSQSTTNILSVETQTGADIVTLESLITQFFNQLCRIQDYKFLQTELNKILSASKLKTQTKSLATKDYLILLDAANYIDRRSQDFSLHLDDLETQFANYGETIIGAVRRIRGHNGACTDPALLNIAKPSSETISAEDFAKGSGAELILESQREAQRKNVDLLKVSLQASLVPYVGLREYSDRPSNYQRQEGIVGVRFTYQFEGQDKKLEIRSELERLRALTISAKQAQADVARDVEVLRRTIVRSKQYLDIIKKSLATSRELVRVLHLQLDLGLIDPTAAGQAFGNYSLALKEARDTWEIAKLAEQQLDEIDAQKKRISLQLKTILK